LFDVSLGGDGDDGEVIAIQKDGSQLVELGAAGCKRIWTDKA
jgi:hypothetical protein